LQHYHIQQVERFHCKSDDVFLPLCWNDLELGWNEKNLRLDFMFLVPGADIRSISFFQKWRKQVLGLTCDGLSDDDTCNNN